jgi:dihydrofolate reductase
MPAIIVAYANKRVIGAGNELPWYIPADLKRFKELTQGNVAIMGRKTFDSIIARNGKPLPNRLNIVISRTITAGPGYTVVATIEDALAAAGDRQTFIIGGAQIYEAALPSVDTVYLTKVDAAIEGDTFFPKLEDEDWDIVSHEPQEDASSPYPYRYIKLQRKPVA